MATGFSYLPNPFPWMGQKLSGLGHSEEDSLQSYLQSGQDLPPALLQYLVSQAASHGRRGGAGGTILTPGDTSGASLEGVRIGGDGPKIGPDGNVQAPQGPQMPPTLFEQLMGMASGANSRSALRAATAPQRAAIHALQENLGMIGAQTEQSQADINSWFGQLGGMYSGNARAAGKAGRKAARGDARTGRGLMKGIADPNVAGTVGRTAARQAGYARIAGNEEAAFARNQAADASRQGSYQQLVQARLGAQAEADVRSQIAQAQAAKVAARSEAKSGNMDNMLQLLGLVGDNPTVDSILGVPHQGDEGPTAMEKGSAIQSALGNVDFFKSGDDGGAPTGDFNTLLTKAYAAARARGLNLNDPTVREGIRSYIQANVVGDYNAFAGTHYGLTPQGSFGGGQ
jgi:hypothetical protein